MTKLKFYVTTEDKEKLRKKFLNFRFYSLISIPDILEQLGLNYNNLEPKNLVLINQTIKRKIESTLKVKKYFAIIYVNPWVNYEVIKNLHDYLGILPKISFISILDRKTKPKNINMWQYFEEVTFFPETRKRIINECECLPTQILIRTENEKKNDSE